MWQNKENEAWDALLDENGSDKNEIKNLHMQIQQLEAKLGQYLEQKHVERLVDNMDSVQSEQQSDFVHFHLILDLLHESRTPCNDLYETVITIWSMLR